MWVLFIQKLISTGMQEKRFISWCSNVNNNEEHNIWWCYVYISLKVRTIRNNNNNNNNNSTKGHKVFKEWSNIKGRRNVKGIKLEFYHDQIKCGTKSFGFMQSRPPWWQCSKTTVSFIFIVSHLDSKMSWEGNNIIITWD